MATILLQGKQIHTIGELPKVGSPAPDFTVTKTDLSEVSLTDFLGKKTIISIFPSVDTGTCAASVRKFNEAIDNMKNISVLCVSADLPFAQKRFCAAEDLMNVVTASVFRHPEFGKNFGVTITDGPLAGLLSRAVILLDEKGNVTYTQQVPELTAEPTYDDIFKQL